VTFNLSAGSHDTTFTVTPTNGAGTEVPLAAGASKSYPVTLDAAHPGATVTANGSTLASYTRPDSCDETTPGGGGGTSVLGEKFTHTPATTASGPAVAGNATALPMTGYAPSRTAELGALLCLVGFAATVAGHRRRAPKHRYIQVRN
jgi:hypothetical protein